MEINTDGEVRVFTDQIKFYREFLANDFKLICPPLQCSFAQSYQYLINVEQAEYAEEVEFSAKHFNLNAAVNTVCHFAGKTSVLCLAGPDSSLLNKLLIERQYLEALSHELAEFNEQINLPYTPYYNSDNLFKQNEDELLTSGIKTISHLQKPGKAYLSLTQAEREVCKLLLQGLSVKQIANQRSRSVKTVETQINIIRQKTKTADRFELNSFLRPLIKFLRIHN
jgi:DNA-binding CsgD family transcriptional regulator